MRRALRAHVRVIFSLAAFSAAGLLVSAAVADEPKLSIKFSPPDAFIVGPYQGALDAANIDADGVPAAAVGASGLVLTTKAPIERDTEILVRFRVTLPKGQGSGLNLVAGQKAGGESAANPLALQLYVYPAADTETLSWTLAPLAGEPSGAAGSYFSRTMPVNRLLLADLTRGRVEQDFASAPTLQKRWFTLRYQLRDKQARVWLDGRLLREARRDDVNTRGFARINLWNGAQLAEATLSELPPLDPRFETVGLEHDLNSSQLAGAAVDRASLPAAGQVAVVGGVPFLVPASDARGRTHIDMKPSWIAAGLSDGGVDPAYGDFARWRGALDRDPARIRFRVPNGKYTKLHLLAAATGEADTVSSISAQFYREYAGHPIGFTAQAPRYTDDSGATLPVAAGAARGKLHLVTIPLEPNGVAAFGDHRHLEMELTKELMTYRAFPDPTYYSTHGAGLPSGVQVFGVTLERAAVEVDLQPDQVGHIWTAPAQPSYTVALKNNTPAAQSVELALSSTSHDGQEKTTVRGSATLEPWAKADVKLALTLARHGHHDVTLTVQAGKEKQTHLRSLAFLHADTRERGQWAEGKGPIFGMWDWNGGHVTVGGLDRLKILAAAGMESSMSSFSHLPAEDQKYLESIGAKSFFLAYQLSMSEATLGGVKWDPTKPDEMGAALVKWLKTQPYTNKSPINEPELAVFFAEPLLGPVSYMSQPEHYGEPPYQMTPAERENYKRMLDQFVIAARAIKKEWPHAKCLFPWGIPTFPIPFLRESKEATELMDGPALDMVMFERMPEMQLHQVTFSSAMWQLRQEWLKTGKPWPKLSTIEGPGTSPARPGAVTAQEEADHTVRAVLWLASYNTTRFLGWPGASHCAGYWGEQHYGSGLLEPLPLLYPRPVYASYATMTRQLNRMNFVKLIPTPSASVFCLQFQHYKSGEPLHVFWTLRGTRPVSLEIAPGAALEVFDSMDNAAPVAVKDGRASFTIGASPVYVRGYKGDAKPMLGEPNHSDSGPGRFAERIGDLGDGGWSISTERDLDYEEVHHEFIRKFPATFTLHAADGPAGKDGQGGRGKALAVRLEKPEKERRTMPFYTTLKPARPIEITGRADELGLWVKAASDWGRVVYSLRDAKGERWLSVGKKGEWNVDDTHSWSAFNFDGWRYLKFELPGNAPYDLYRAPGTSFWGAYHGDWIVDLPLTLEKIIVERRTHVIHATEQLPAAPDDVLLGGLFAEYAAPKGDPAEAVRLSRLRMPLPEKAPELANPIRLLEETGAGAGTDVASVAPPEREYDGRRCHVRFAPAAGAKSYDVWVTTYADGRGAILLGKDWAGPDQLLTGLSPNVDLYLFVVAKDAEGKPSKPGKPFKVNLKDMFPQK